MRILGSRKPGFTSVALTLPVLATALLALPAPPSAAATPRPDTAVRWEKCQGTGLDPRQECATLAVPLDREAVVAGARIPWWFRQDAVTNP
ncbi:hypothetical protein OG905_22200 [Streptomyces sp. NBC_00322]|uniref:hypothetical protein n=1 Tax=Streptomyces sp. NBC_00322 TaxID=2975712 RepID=UPI002E2C92A6|nr:hypothetical protein [Streptomyces sp. NBC_00322]